MFDLGRAWDWLGTAPCDCDVPRRRLRLLITSSSLATSLSHDAKDVYFIDKDPPENSEEFIEEFDPLDSELDEGRFSHELSSIPW